MLRELYILVLVGLIAPAAYAQTPLRAGKPARVAIFVTSPIEGQIADLVKLFEDGMRERGWHEGKNVVYDRDPPARHLREKSEMLEHATKLIKRNPDIIWLVNTENAIAVATVQRERKTQIPIVGSSLSDAVVEVGLANPNPLGSFGSNVTGVVSRGWELGAKRLELAHDLIPGLARVGVLVYTPREISLQEFELIEKAAKSARITVVPARIKNERDLELAFAQLAKTNAQAVLTTHVPFLQNQGQRIAELAAEQRLPVIGHRASLAEQGAVISYGASSRDQMRRSAYLVDKILKGAKPADLPVEGPDRYELVLNRKMAKALGVSIPENVLVRVDRFID